MNRYKICLADTAKDHWTSQANTGSAIRKAGFVDAKWYMGSALTTGESTHTWTCIGEEQDVTRIKLSAHVVSVKLEEIHVCRV